MSQDVIQALHELDIRRIEQLQRLPRESLPSRFGSEISLRLDQAMGAVDELITPVHLPEPVEARWDFEESTANRRAVEAAIRELLQQITKQLVASQQSIRSLLVCLKLKHDASTDAGNQQSFTVGLVSPRTTTRQLDELVFMQLERKKLRGKVASIYLLAATSALPTRSQHQLFDAEKQKARHLLAALIERLSSRLGERSVLCPRLYPDAQPELAYRFESRVEEKPKVERPVSTASSSGPSLWTFDSRPLTLRRPSTLHPPTPVNVLSIIPEGPPMRLRWQGREHEVVRNWGPERIETGWWRDRHVQRDYYRVETNQGQQFWLFRCRDAGDWFLQGAFG